MDRPGKTYYVSEAGDDRNTGLSPERPWRTIGRSADAMRAGDRCVVRGGVYRETIAPAASGREGAPIRFEAQPGERVIVSGCDPLEKWILQGNDLYAAEMDWNVGGECGNIVFIDGEICHEAMWPRITDRLDRAQYARVDDCSCDAGTWTIYDEDLLQFPDGYWNGAIVACVNGVSYFTSTARVQQFRSGTLYFEPWVSSAPHYHTTPGDLYFLTRSPCAATLSGGWYYDAGEGKMLLRLADDGDPGARGVEAKRRSYAFDLRGKSWIEVAGFDIRAASITTDNAHHCRIADVRVTGIDRWFGDRQSVFGRTQGIELGGSDNELSNSDIGCFEGIGIHISGQGNRVANCHIHDGNWEASYASLVWMTGSGHLLSRCTIARAGRTCVSGVFARSVIQFCDIGYANLLTKDSGIIYLFNHDFDNTDIHHNWLHDNESPHLSFGFYMDAWTSGINFYRNVVWNVPHNGLRLNRPLQRTLVYNNTFLRSGNAASTEFVLDDMYGVHLVNNIFSEGRLVRWGEDSLTTHNLFGVAAGFVDADNRDFRLCPDSPARGAGLPIVGVTDDCSATQLPDLGAYQSGEPYWTPGHDFTRQAENVLVYSTLRSKSALGNGGFESGEWAPWTVVVGEPELVSECAWDYCREDYASVVRSNKYSAALPPGAKIEQRVCGLEPNTVYELWAGVKSDGIYRNAERCDTVQSGSPVDRELDGTYAIYRSLRYVGPLGGGDWILFRDVDFGALGIYDHVAVGMTKVTAPVAVEVRLDRPDGKKIGVVPVGMKYDGAWRYFSAPMTPATGVRDVYFVVTGPGNVNISGMKTYPLTAGCVAEVTVAHPDGTAMASRDIMRRHWETKMTKLVFRTGPEQTEATVSVANVFGSCRVYLDDFGLWRPDLI